MAEDLLKVLEENRDLIITTEIVGWLHDIGKLDKERNQKHCKRNILDFGFASVSPFGNLDFSGLSPLQPPEPLISFLRKRLTDPYISQDEITDWLDGSREIALPLFTHHKKGIPDRGGLAPETQPACIYELIIDLADTLDSEMDRQSFVEISDMEGVTTPFGLRININVNDLSRKRQMLYDSLSQRFQQENLDGGDTIVRNLPLLRNILRPTLRGFLEGTSADTRLGINDVTLWDHSFMTGSIARCILAHCILNENLRTDFSQRLASQGLNAVREELKISSCFSLLTIKFYGLNYILHSLRTVDFLGRYSVLRDFIKATRELIEEGVLLGVQIYEDLDGVYFLVPAFREGKQQIKESIEARLKEVCRDKKLLVQFAIDISDPIRAEQIPDKLSHQLTKKHFIEPPVEEVTLAWKGRAADRCEVCGLYPMKRISIRNERICQNCEEIRRRATPRMDSFDAAFTEECADKEGRLCLMFGWFRNLPAWLSGEVVRQTKGCRASGLHKDVQSRLHSEGDLLPKEISPSRSRAIWRTTEEWVSETLGSVRGFLSNKYKGNSQRVRFLFPLKLPSGEESGFYKVVEPDFLSEVLLLPEKGAYTIEALAGESVDMARGLQSLLLKRADGKEFAVNLIAQPLEIPYVPMLKIFENPRSFAFLLPAKDAIEVSRRITDGFNHSFGLSMTGIGFDFLAFVFKQKYPLYVVFDTLRRFLAQSESLHETMPVDINISAMVKVSGLSAQNKEQLEQLFRQKGFDPILSNGELQVLDDCLWEDRGARIRNAFGICKNFAPRRYYQVRINGVTTIEVEVEDPKKDLAGELIRQNYPVTEALVGTTSKVDSAVRYFDFELLDSSTRRFDIRLENGRRPHPLFGSRHSPRPYLFEDFSKFDRLWTFLKSMRELTDTKLRNIESLLVSKFEEWGLKKKEKDSNEWETWERLVETTLVREFSWGKDTDDFEFVKEAIISGLFFDCLDLNMRILKRKLKEE